MSQDSIRILPWAACVCQVNPAHPERCQSDWGETRPSPASIIPMEIEINFTSLQPPLNSHLKTAGRIWQVWWQQTMLRWNAACFGKAVESYYSFPQGTQLLECCVGPPAQARCWQTWVRAMKVVWGPPAWGMWCMRRAWKSFFIMEKAKGDLNDFF